MPHFDWPTIRDLRDVEALESVPWKERLGTGSVVEEICARSEEHPDKVAIRFLPRGLLDDTPEDTSYRALARGIRRTANLLRGLGVGRTDVVSLLVPPLLQSHLAIWGGSTAGIASPVNFLLEADAIAEIIAESGARVLVAYDDDDGFGIWDKVQRIREKVPALTTILRIGRPDAPLPTDPGVLDFDTAIAGQQGDRFDFDPAISGEQTAFYIHTGGTTDTPKLTRITHDNILFKAWSTPAMQGLREDETIFGAAPLYHIGGIEPSSAVPFCLGMTLLIPGTRGLRNKALIRDYWKYFSRFGISRLYGVPTTYMATANVPLDGADLSTLRPRIAVGSAPLPAELARRYQQLVGVTMSNLYGLTEGCAAVSVSPPDGEVRFGSCGIRYPYVKLRAVWKKGDEFVECPTGESGEIAVKGPNMVPGYLKDSQNAGLFTPDGYLLTGDIGRFDADGYLWITGRSKDIIVRGGHNLDPQVTEEAIFKHPAVGIAGAVAMPDPYAGELPVAFVEFKAGATASADEIRDFARAQVQERASAPTEVFVLDRMPLTAIGKVDKAELRKRAAAHHFAGLLRAALGEACADGLQMVEVPSRGLVARIDPTTVDRSDAEGMLDKVFAPYTIGWSWA